MQKKGSPIPIELVTNIGKGLRIPEESGISDNAVVSALCRELFAWYLVQQILEPSEGTEETAYKST